MNLIELHQALRQLRLGGMASVLETRLQQAQAEAMATQFVSDAIAAGNSQAINYFVAQKYIDALGQLAASSNSKVILMPLEASQVIGSLAGIQELIKTAQQENKS